MIALAGARGHEPARRAADLRPRRARARRVLSVRRFSPEWQAIRYALDRDIPVRFMDLPAANQMAERGDDGAASARDSAPIRSRRWPRSPASATGSAGGRRRRVAPRGHDAFAAITRRWRRSARPPDGRLAEERREASMRQTIRAASQGARERSPSSAAPGTPPRSPTLGRRERRSALKGLPKVKVAATWVPWTYGLLARERLRRRRRLARLVRPPLGRRRRSVARWLSRPPRCCAPKASTRPPPRSSRRSGWRRARRHARPAAGGPRGPGGRDPRGALLRLRRPARAGPRRAGRRPPARRGPRGHAHRAAPADVSRLQGGCA